VPSSSVGRARSRRDTAPEFPGERLVECKNPLLTEKPARRCEDLLHATEAALAKLADQIAHGTGPETQDSNLARIPKSGTLG
jgi:hypothetical protein